MSTLDVFRSVLALVAAGLEGDTLELVAVWTRNGKRWEGVREFVRAK